MRFFLTIISLLLLLAQASFADISIATSISGVSEVRTDSDDSNKVEAILGGIAGSIGTCSGSTTVCDSCVNTNFPCSKSRINKDVVISLQYTYSNGSIDGNKETHLEAKDLSDSDNDFVGIDIDSGAENFSSNETKTLNVTLKWGNICESFGADCETPGAFELRVGIIDDDKSSYADADSSEEDFQTIKVIVAAPDNSSTNYNRVNPDCTSSANGICSFNLFPGDQKLHIVGDNRDSQPQISGGLTSTEIKIPNSSEEIEVTGIRAYVIESSFGDTDPLPGDSNVFIKDMSLKSSNDGWDFEDVDIEGLENNIPYHANLALIDEAGNVTFLTDSGRQGTPDEVIGLLAEELNCFIATAAYGSILDKRINIFRKFRNKVLNSSYVGKKLIQLYYRHGKKAASYIHKSETLKFVARLALWPALLFASLSLKIGLANSLLLLLGSLLFISLGLRARRRSSHV